MMWQQPRKLWPNMTAMRWMVSTLAFALPRIAQGKGAVLGEGEVPGEEAGEGVVGAALVEEEEEVKKWQHLPVIQTPFDVKF